MSVSRRLVITPGMGIGPEVTLRALAHDGWSDVVLVGRSEALAVANKQTDLPLVAVRDLDQPHLQAGLDLGRGVLKALGMGTGFTHMEWYRKSDGEVVFGEIGCRAGGARLVDQMNYTSDTDLFLGWARAVCGQPSGLSNKRMYNAAIVFKRAQGKGTIHRIEGLDELVRDHRHQICAMDLLPIGARRRDWTQTLISDGWLIVRDPDWTTALEVARRAADTVHLYAH